MHPGGGAVESVASDSCARRAQLCASCIRLLWQWLQGNDACREVIEPRMYQVYRALLLPDCLLWSGRGKDLLDMWEGSFEHPAVVEARAR